MGEDIESVYEPEHQQARLSTYGLRALGGLGVTGGLSSFAFGVYEFTSENLLTIYHGERLLEVGFTSIFIGSLSLIKSGVMSNWLA